MATEVFKNSFIIEGNSRDDREWSVVSTEKLTFKKQSLWRHHDFFFSYVFHKSEQGEIPLVPILVERQRIFLFWSYQIVSEMNQ